MGAAETPLEGGSTPSTSVPVPPPWHLLRDHKCHHGAKRPEQPAPALPALLSCDPMSSGQESLPAASSAVIEKSRQNSSTEITMLSQKGQ